MPAEGAALATIPQVVHQRGLTATMADGVKLVADAWYPAVGGPWPVLLQRLPYGRSVASAPVLPSPTQLARLGYAVVVQDVRGRGSSEGEFVPFAYEAADGAATVEWATQLPFSNGDVAMYGFSYQGVNQLAAAALRPQGLRAIAPLMCAPSPTGMVYEGDCLLWAATVSWAAQLANQQPGTPLRRADPEVLPACAAIGEGAPGWYLDWLDHRPGDVYWESLAPDLSAIDVPVFTVLGYADTFSLGTSRLAQALGAEVVCGPWAHMPWGTQVGGLEMPDASPAVALDAFVGFLARVLRPPLPARPPERPGDQAVVGPPGPPPARAHYYVVNDGWRSAPAWPPPANTLTWVATSLKGANSRHGDGQLWPTSGWGGPGGTGGGAGPASAGGPLAASGEPPRLDDIIVSEPLVPHPGELTPYPERAASEDRRDVLCYTSGPVPFDLTVAGNPVVRATAEADAASFDLFAGLVLVGPQGARCVSQGGARLEPAGIGTTQAVEVEMRPVAWKFPAGSRLRLEVSASRFPLYGRNPQPAGPTNLPPGEIGRQGHAVATVSVRSLVLELPVASPAGPPAGYQGGHA